MLRSIAPAPGAEELHRQRPLLGHVAGERLGPGVAVNEGAGVDLLAGQRARAALAAHQPERRIRDAGHRRQAQVERRHRSSL